MTQPALRKDQSPSRRSPVEGERGYALLSLLLALSIISIYLVSSVVPNVKMSVQRVKEQEMVYRGNQMAKAIARFYGSGRVMALNMLGPPQYGYLTELKKLSQGVTMGVREIKFARGSEMIDPMTGVEWEPVRLRDPRINGILQAYAAKTGAIISPQYLLLAGAPARQNKSIFDDSGDSSSSSPRPGTPPGTTPGQPAGQPAGQAGTNPRSGEDPNDPDDPEEVNDPLAHLFENSSDSSFGKSTVPIIGVAPRLKGPSIVPLKLGDVVLDGIEDYEKWVFFYIPPQGFTQGPAQGIQPVQPPAGGGGNGNGCGSASKPLYEPRRPREPFAFFPPWSCKMFVTPGRSAFLRPGFSLHYQQSYSVQSATNP
jgi:type II secretory pathway pseudopilin PulG